MKFVLSYCKMNDYDEEIQIELIEGGNKVEALLKSSLFKDCGLDEEPIETLTLRSLKEFIGESWVTFSVKPIDDLLNNR